MTIRQTIILLILTILFFGLGQIEYESIYQSTLYSVKTLSSVPIRFFGKFPFWFGDTRLSAIIAIIPLTVFLPSKILRRDMQTLLISTLTYGICLIVSYMFICFVTGLNFHVSNDRYQGEIIEKNLLAININQTVLSTIVLTTFLTSLTFGLVRFIGWARLKIFRTTPARQNASR